MTEFSRRLRQARIDASITQEQLAKAMNVSKSTISMWENGNRMPSVSVLLPLAEALKTTPAYLSGGAYKMVDGETYPASSFRDSAVQGYSFARGPGEADEMSQLIDIALGLDDAQLEQLIKYAEFLSQEDK